MRTPHPPTPVYTSIKNSNTASYHQVRLEGTDRALNTAGEEQERGRGIQNRGRGGGIEKCGRWGEGDGWAPPASGAYNLMVATETPGQTGGRDRRRNCGGEGLPSGPPRAPGSRWRWRVQPEGAGWGHGGVFGGWVSCMAPSPEEGRGAGMVWRGLGSAGPGLPGSLQIVSEENAEGPPARVQNRNRGLRAQLRPPAPLQVRWHVLTGCRAQIRRLLAVAAAAARARVTGTLKK